MMIAPTSAMARPKAARNAVSSEARPSEISSVMLRRRDRPSVRGEIGIFGPQQRSRAMHQRHHDRGGEDHLGDDHGGGCEQQAGEAEWTGAREQEIERKPRHHRRQAEQRIGQYDDASPPRNRLMASSAPSGAPIASAIRLADRLTRSDSQDDAEQFGIEAADQRKGRRDRLREIVHSALRSEPGERPLVRAKRRRKQDCARALSGRTRPTKARPIKGCWLSKRRRPTPI